MRLAPMAALLMAAAASPAFAHVTLDPPEAPAGSYVRAALRVPHGCAGAATTRVTLDLPEGIYSAKPMPKPGWRLTIERRRLPQAVRSPHGRELDRRVVDVGIDQFVHELEVAAGDVEQVAERLWIEAIGGHVGRPPCCIPATAWTGTGRLKPFNWRSPAGAASMTSSAATKVRLSMRISPGAGWGGGQW